jgi:glycosyltransferase involved in cell wall biosynthesis
MNAYSGRTLKYAETEDGEKFPYKMYGSMFQNYFQDTISNHLKQTKSDVFIILLDTFMMFPWLLNLDLSPAKTYFWFPSDGGGGLPLGCENILRKVNCPVAMAKFGQKQVKDYYGIDTKFIPHCCDSNIFYQLPKEERLNLKRKWGFQDKFVIGIVARNQPRKNLDRSLKIMYLLKDKIPNAVLLCHLDPNDPAQQMFNIPSLIRKYGLENRVVFTGMSAFKGFSESQLNEIYNLMDVFLLTTSGEGFGIPIIEAMSCQIPVLATDYTTTPELVIENKSGLGINLSGVETIDMYKENLSMQEYDQLVLNGTITGTWEVERGICSMSDGVEKLIYLYKNPEEREKMGKNGRKAVLEKYDYSIVSKQWSDLINE